MGCPSSWNLGCPSSCPSSCIVPNDYVPADTLNVNGGAQINDRPSVYIPGNGSMKGRLDHWAFSAKNWITEAKDITGTYSASISWSWNDPFGYKWDQKSSDGKINESNTSY